MFTLVRDRCKYFRVKRGQSGEEIEAELCIPAKNSSFAGAIISCAGKFKVYIAKPGDCYKSLAERFGISEEELKKTNSSKLIYPSCKLFVPCKK